MTRVFEAGQRWVRRNGDGGEFPRDDDSVILFVDIGSSGFGTVVTKSVRTMNFNSHSHQELESIKLDAVTKWEARAFSAAHSRLRGDLPSGTTGSVMMALVGVASAVTAYVKGVHFLELQAWFLAGYAVSMLSVTLNSIAVKVRG